LESSITEITLETDSTTVFEGTKTSPTASISRISPGTINDIFIIPDSLIYKILYAVVIKLAEATTGIPIRSIADFFCWLAHSTPCNQLKELDSTEHSELINVKIMTNRQFS